VGLNLGAGVRLAPALASGLVGPVVMGIFVVIMDAIAWAREGSIGPTALKGTSWVQRRSSVLVALLVLWVFWLLTILDRLQENGSVPGTRVLGLLPGWRACEGLLDRLSENLTRAFDLWPVPVIHVTIQGLVLRVALPAAILLLMGMRWRDLGLSVRGWVVGLPLLIVELLAFAAQGPSARQVAAVGRSFLYPGLAEEFFYRSLLQRSLSGWLQSMHCF